MSDWTLGFLMGWLVGVVCSGIGWTIGTLIS